MKRAFILVLLLIQLSAAAHAAPWTDKLGTQMTDFEVACADGSSFTLSGALEQKALVAVGLFSSRCGLCLKELPYLQEAYEKYQDEVEIIMLSMDRAFDTDERLLEVADAYELTYLLGRDPLRLALYLDIDTMPALMLVDRFGNIVHVETEVPDSGAYYEGLFEQFLGEDYTQSFVPTPTTGEA